MIRGQHTGIRAWERADVPAYHKWCSDPDTRRLFDATDDQRPLEYYQQRHAESLTDPNFRQYAAVLLPDQLIGWCRWIRTRPFGVYDVGILIGPDHQGQGYGKEIMSLLLPMLFQSLSAHKVQATTFEFNDRSQRLFLGLGFSEEGRSRDDVFCLGRHWATIRLGLLRSEYLSREGLT